jgi:hypothetical protein
LLAARAAPAGVSATMATTTANAVMSRIIGAPLPVR